MSYKLNIPESEDWRTDTDNTMINVFREVMKYNNQFQDDPNIGIFWYDPNEKELFGVYSVFVDDVDYFFSLIFNAEAKTCKRMHYALWQKECNKGKDKRFQTMDYTKYPRGRVFEVKDEGFKVCVGRWIKDYPEAKQLILDEFQLPEDTEFIIDGHWDLGRGWSDKEL